MEGAGVGRMRVALLSDQNGGAGGALLDDTQVGMKKTSVDTTVPAAATAKLMYYLNCMLSLVSDGVFSDRTSTEGLRKLRNYSNYQALSHQEVDLLLMLCIMLSPDEFIGKLIFPDDGTLCDGTNTNDFYEITAARTRVAVVENVTIGGRQTAVRKIMAFKRSWLTAYYIEPMATFESRLRQLAAAAQGSSSGSGSSGSSRPTVGDSVLILSGSGAGTHDRIVQDDHDSRPYKLAGESGYYREDQVRKVASGTVGYRPARTTPSTTYTYRMRTSDPGHSSSLCRAAILALLALASPFWIWSISGGNFMGIGLYYTQSNAGGPELFSDGICESYEGSLPCDDLPGTLGGAKALCEVTNKMCGAQYHAAIGTSAAQFLMAWAAAKADTASSARNLAGFSSVFGIVTFSLVADVQYLLASVRSSRGPPPPTPTPSANSYCLQDSQDCGYDDYCCDSQCNYCGPAEYCLRDHQQAVHYCGQDSGLTCSRRYELCNEAVRALDTAPPKLWGALFDHRARSAMNSTTHPRPVDSAGQRGSSAALRGSTQPGRAVAGFYDDDNAYPTVSSTTAPPYGQDDDDGLGISAPYPYPFVSFAACVLSTMYTLGVSCSGG